MRIFRALSISVAVVMIVAGIGAACSGEDSPAVGSNGTGTASGTNTQAAALRSDLNRILSEHVLLAATATGAALGGRDAEFRAAAFALDANSVEFAKELGSVYGPNAETAFLDGWRRHIGFFVQYTNGAATKDQAKKDAAVVGLGQYANDLGTLLNAANGMSKDEVVKLTTAHAEGLLAVIDAQAAGDQAKAYELLRTAAGHMHAIADPLAEATVRKFPEKFKG